MLAGALGGLRKAGGGAAGGPAGGAGGAPEVLPAGACGADKLPATPVSRCYPG